MEAIHVYPAPLAPVPKHFALRHACLQYLLQGGCRYRVSTVYLWNLQSWDPQAIYPLPFADAASQAANPTAYYDPVVVATINAHNAEAAARADGCAARAPEPKLEAELAVASIVPPAC